MCLLTSEFPASLKCICEEATNWSLRRARTKAEFQTWPFPAAQPQANHSTSLGFGSLKNKLCTHSTNTLGSRATVKPDLQTSKRRGPSSPAQRCLAATTGLKTLHSHKVPLLDLSLYFLSQQPLSDFFPCLVSFFLLRFKTWCLVNAK